MSLWPPAIPPPPPPMFIEPLSSPSNFPSSLIFSPNPVVTFWNSTVRSPRHYLPGSPPHFTLSPNRRLLARTTSTQVQPSFAAPSVPPPPPPLQFASEPEPVAPRIRAPSPQRTFPHTPGTIPRAISSNSSASFVSPRATSASSPIATSYLRTSTTGTPRGASSSTNVISAWDPLRSSTAPLGPAPLQPPPPPPPPPPPQPTVPTPRASPAYPTPSPRQRDAETSTLLTSRSNMLANQSAWLKTQQSLVSANMAVR